RAIPGGWRVERQEAVLAVEDAEPAGLLGDLERAQVAVVADRLEGQALVRGHDHRAGDGRQLSRLAAIREVGDQLLDLSPDDRALVGIRALSDATLQDVPVHPRARRALGGGRLRDA